MPIEETEEEKNTRVSTAINNRLLAEVALPIYDNKTQVEAFMLFMATEETASVTRPKTLTLAGLLSGLSSGSKARLRDWNDAQNLKAAILAQDRSAIGIYLDLLVSGDELTPPLIEPSEGATVMGELVASETVDVVTQITPRSYEIIRGIPRGPNTITEEQFIIAWTAIRGA